jgi:hypothetical protein
MLIRIIGLIAVVVAAVVVSALVAVWWVTLIAAAVLIAATVATVLLILHYTSAPDWLGPSEEAELQDAGLVEPETGLPKRRRWNEQAAREYAAQVSRRGVVAVPDGWRGPRGSHHVLLLTTVPLSVQQLRTALPDSLTAAPLAVLVVVPTLASSHRALRIGNASEAVDHAEKISQQTVAALRDSGIDVSGHIGPADPAVALSDGLRTYAAELVIVARHASGAGRYLEHVPLRDAAQVFGVPMRELVVNGASKVERAGQ